MLKAVARQRLAAAGRARPGPDAGRRSAGPGAPLPITSSRMGHLWDALCRAYDVLGFDAAAGGDEVFRALVLARIIEPTSKLDSLRVLDRGRDRRAVVSDDQAAAAGATRSDDVAAGGCAGGVRGARRARPGDAGALRRDHVVLRDRRGRRVPRARVLQGTPAGAADHRRAVDRRRRVPAAGRTRSRATPPRPRRCCPVHQAFMAAHRLAEVTVVADAGMMSEANQARDRGRRADVHRRRPDPRRPLPGRASGASSIPARTDPDGQIFTQPWPAGADRQAARRPDDLLPVPGRPGPAHPAGHRPADRQGREGRRRARRRSSGTGSSHLTGATKTVNRTWRPRPARWPG